MSAHDVRFPNAAGAGIGWAVAGRGEAARATRGALATLLEPGATLESCRLRRVKLKPDRKLTVHYDARVRSRGVSRVRPVVAVWTREGTRAADDGTAPLEAAARAAGLAAPFLALRAEVPSLALTLRVSPLDPGLPQLLPLSDPRHAAELIARSGRRAGAVRVSTVRYRPGERHVLRYDTARGGPGNAVFAKLSRRDADVGRAAALAERIADWLEQSGAAVRAVRPLACATEEQALLFPQVAGRPLSDAVRRGDTAISGALERAAAALRALHAAPAAVVRLLPARDFARDLAAVRRASEHIAALLPRVGAAIETTLERAFRVYASIPAEPPGFTHGDFKADHLWIARERVTLLDFGSCAAGDPAVDIGKFLADLEWWAPSAPGAAAVRAAFCRAYAGTGSRARLERAAVYEVLFLLMFAAHRVPLWARDWEPRTARQVRRAGARLERLHSPR